MLAFSEMRLQLERAVETWPDGARGADVQLFRAAEAAWLAGDASGARSLAQQAFDQGAAVDPERLAALGNYAWDTGDFPGAVEAFERAGSLLTNDTASSVRAESLIGLARARTTRGQYAAACRIATDAIREARSACALSAEARGLFIRGIAKVFAGDLSGVEDLERGVLRAVEARSPAAVGHGYQYLTNCVRYSGTLERALAIAREGIDACDRLGLARSHGSDLRAWAAAFLIELGRWDEAAALLSTADSRAPVHLGSGTLAMRKGRFAHARTELDRAAASGWIAGRRGLDGSLELARAELSWLTGDLAEASAALAEMPELPDTLPVASLVSRRARLLFRIAADDPRHAPATLPEPDPRDVRYDASCVRAEIEAERVRAAGNVDPQLWSACVRAWERTGIVYDATYARFRYAEALLSAGERDQAKDALRQAATDASGLGALPLRALVDDLARRARLVSSPQRRRTASYDELTARECDVLALLADGLTNREIAGRLFLSAKTVGIHVTHLLQKLDAHTRGEAVAAARRRGLIE
jgi:DNA-binding CsgD family transcriptional regulator